MFKLHIMEVTHFFQEKIFPEDNTDPVVTSAS